MRTVLSIVITAVAALAALGAPAHATTVTSDGRTVAVTGAPGEANWVQLDTTTACGDLPAPCLHVGESVTVALQAAGACRVAPASTFVAVVCPLPASVTVDTGDQADRVYDWDGPSEIRTGPGEDIAEGRGGDDVLDGGAGSDTLVGGPGDDRLSGGEGGDRFEANLWPIDAFPVETAGADRIAGGPGVDLVSYRAREDALSFTVDDLANDGAPGEGDLIGRDVEAIQAGAGADTMTGDGGANTLMGGYGPDTSDGGAGDDVLSGGPQDDRVFGGAGADSLQGGHGDDVLDGGPGGDDLVGDWALNCSLSEPCEAGADVIRAQDGFVDSVNCGMGTDAASVDAFDSVLQVAGVGQCERVAVARTTRRTTGAVARCAALHSRSARARCVRRARCRLRRSAAARRACLRSVKRGRR